MKKRQKRSKADKTLIFEGPIYVNGPCGNKQRDWTEEEKRRGVDRMGHDEKHYPCECKERETVKTDKGFIRICKECGHTFKEVIHTNTLTQDFIKGGGHYEDSS